jgi:hypothetical protein
MWRRCVVLTANDKSIDKPAQNQGALYDNKGTAMKKVKAYQSETDKWLDFDVLAELRYIGESNSLCFIHNKIYACVGIEGSTLRIIDETGEDYLFPAALRNWQVVSDYSEGKIEKYFQQFSNYYVTVNLYDQIPTVIDYDSHCFFVVNQIDNQDFINDLAEYLIKAKIRDFIFYGKYEPLWHRKFDDMDIALNGDADEVILTSGWHTLEKFADILKEEVPYYHCYLFYDDEKVLEQINQILHKEDEGKVQRTAK